LAIINFENLKPMILLQYKKRGDKYLPLFLY